MIRDILRLIINIDKLCDDTVLRNVDDRDNINRLYEDIKKYERRGNPNRNMLWEYIKEYVEEVDYDPEIKSYIDNNNFEYDFNDEGKYDSGKYKVFHIIDTRFVDSINVHKIVLKKYIYNVLDSILDGVGEIYDEFYEHINTIRFLSYYNTLNIVSIVSLTLSILSVILACVFENKLNVFLMGMMILFVIVSLGISIISGTYAKYVKTINEAVTIYEYARNMFFPNENIYDETYEKDNVTVCFLNE